MEKLKPWPKIHHNKIVFLLLVGILLLACSFFSQPGVPNSTPGPGTAGNNPTVQTVQTGQPSSSSDIPTREPDPLDRLLTMRSIQIDLICLYPDGRSRSISAGIDSDGNMHVMEGYPAQDPKNLPDGVDPKSFTNGEEFFVLKGKAYQPDLQHPDWMTTPVDDNFNQTLDEEMHGSGGPAEWLDLLPQGSIHAAGQDNVGGFAADKYLVNGKVGDQTISGTIWFEPKVDALIQAELSVPAVLFNPTDKPQPGEVKITLHTQKADITPVSLPTAPAGQPGAAATPTTGSAGSASGPLAVSSHYTLQAAKGMIGSSLTASPGKVWIGTGTGTVVEVDSQSGAFEQSISLTITGTSVMNIFPITRLGFDGQNIWALGGFKQGGADHLFAIDSGSVAIAHQWDLTQWNLNRDSEHRGTAYDFGFSPGKLWVKDQIIDTHTFDAKYAGFIGDPHFAYDGKGWMWMTGVGAEDCDGADFINTDDPSQDRHQCRYPFLNHAKEGYSNVGDKSPLVLAGDRMWITGVWSGAKPTYTLEAFPADVGQLMKETKPLVSVALMDDPEKVKMLYAGNYLWLLWTSGNKPGILYQLDPQTGAILNSLDLVKAQTWDKGGVPIHNDLPIDIAAEGNNLWILTKFQLLNVQMPKTNEVMRIKFDFRLPILAIL
jgi:hypothetical protein